MVLLNSPRNMSVVDFLFLSEPLLFCRRSFSLCCRCVAELCSRIFAPARAPSLALAIGWLRKLFCEPRDLVAVGHRDRLAGPARSAIVNPRQRRHIARCPRCGSVALQVGGNDAARVIEIGAARVVPADACVCVVGAVDLQRSERAAVVAEDGACAPTRLHDVESAEEGVRRRGLHGGRESEEEGERFHEFLASTAAMIAFISGFLYASIA